MMKSRAVKVILFIIIFIGIIFVINNEALKYSKQIDLTSIQDNLQSREKLGQSFYESDRLVQIAKVIFSLGIPLVFLVTGFSAKLRDFSKGIGKTYLLTVGIYGVLYNLIDSILSFPLSYYGGFLQGRIFGLYHQSFLLWFKNYIIGFILSSAIIFIILWIPYKIMSKSPKRGWIHTGLVSIPIIMVMFLAQPVVIDPLFNDFKTIENKKLEKELIELTKKAGVENCNILMVDKSKETSMINAYMTGIGSSKRVVLWDTAIKKLNTSELKFITAHEMGHYVLGHIKKLMIIEIVGIFIIFYIVYAIAPYLLEKHKRRFKIEKMSDIASLPLIMLIINICLIIATPSVNAYSCYIEKEADMYAIEITRDNKAGISSFEKLSQNGIVIPNPDPVYKMWKYDHPPIKERIEFFKNYKPWEKGEELKYFN